MTKSKESGAPCRAGGSVSHNQVPKGERKVTKGTIRLPSGALKDTLYHANLRRADTVIVFLSVIVYTSFGNYLGVTILLKLILCGLFLLANSPTPIVETESRNPYTVKLISDYYHSYVLNDLPSAYYLGMGKVPKYRQGAYGTCVTFAVTAAIDAALERGDYSSKYCVLQLGNYLSKRNALASGWSGITVEELIQRIETYGIINKKYEGLCGEIGSYPVEGLQISYDYITSEQYLKYSENISSKISFIDLFKASANVTLYNIKKNIVQGNRSVISFKLTKDKEIDSDGTYMSYYDTWVLTSNTFKEIINNHPGRHAVIVIGYNDNAVVIDNEGNKHKGVLVLRNSWGDMDFYMTYDYALQYIDDAIVVKRK